jgi:dolichyl-phosphate-mannose--protein O-mannosyl transferase
MNQLRQLFLFITIIVWGTVIGGVTYSHIAYFPSYLSHLPESTNLVKGPYAIRDANFWMLVHPILILSILITLILNWKNQDRRKYIFVAVIIYALAIIATFSYFVPELMAFADSSKSTISATEWLHRGTKWQYLSWVRGFFMYVGFIMLLISLTKNKIEPTDR